MNHFESVVTLNNKVLGFVSQFYELHADPGQISNFVHLVF